MFRGEANLRGHLKQQGEEATQEEFESSSYVPENKDQDT
jgi:hypothetical protein